VGVVKLTAGYRLLGVPWMSVWSQMCSMEDVRLTLPSVSIEHEVPGRVCVVPARELTRFGWERGPMVGDPYLNGGKRLSGVDSCVISNEAWSMGWTDLPPSPPALEVGADLDQAPAIPRRSVYSFLRLCLARRGASRISRTGTAYQASPIRQITQ
jgi:hypothetical protein